MYHSAQASVLISKKNSFVKKKIINPRKTYIFYPEKDRVFVKYI